MNKYFLYIVLLIISGQLTFAQENKTQQLSKVVVFSHFSPKNQFGYNLLVFSDSLLKESNQNLTDLLKKNTNIYIKEYGGGMIASISMRGTAASHTGVYWNGIPINSSLNGQTDFNTFFSAAANQITIRKGGGSVLLGSGAIAGAINLENKLKYDQKTSGSMAASIGSYKKLSTAIGIHHATKKIVLELGFNGLTAKNNYPYLQTDIKNTNAEIKHFNYQFHSGFKLDKKNIIYLKTSANTSDRNTARTLYTTNNANLLYKTNIALLGWEHRNKSFQTKINTAYFNEMYLYTFNKDFANINSKNGSAKYISKFGINFKLTDKLFLNSSFDYTFLTGKGSSINDVKDQIISWVGSVNHQVLDKYFYTASIRKDWTTVYKIPFVFSFDSKQEWNMNHKTKFNISTNYRTPTLNDLYWEPGGNIDLLPENNISTEVSYHFNTKSKRSFKTQFNISIFKSHSKNLIQWRPISGAIWSPININSVTTHGLELDIANSLSFNKFKLASKVQYSYIDSRDNINYKQLIYTPKHMGSLGVSLYHKNWFLSIDENYNGIVYTTYSNSISLGDFWITDIRITKKVFSKKMQLGLSINNLFNKTYQIVESRIMPNRNYAFSFTYSF